ncbi:helix-turn-helix domain-containing protein [Thalassolituus sp. UBA3500]|uniref:helix-turn-helix domain-containing protein n=1 Tax=Thalassolituus sp. UBA3500 TaxID=1947664 RepID=UPI000C110C42|nr:helix-turn-helix transcriptional regulator [Thalassolituus sp. UBA3500]MBN57832.1 DNA-binding protein [Oceanospirillaceae bacterium]|tara:strand:- start:1018 stop:1287 length:270 start_codon:yes stop_codon:yes gene_type:complete
MSKHKAHSPADWHPEDIKAAIRKRGLSVSQLAKDNGYENPRTFLNVLRTPYPKVEGIIATFLEVSPAEIWPSRYGDSTRIRSQVQSRVA